MSLCWFVVVEQRIVFVIYDPNLRHLLPARKPPGAEVEDAEKILGFPTCAFLY